MCRASHYSLMILNGPVQLMSFILTQQAVKSALRHNMQQYESIALAIPSHIAFQANPEAFVDTQTKPAVPTWRKAVKQLRTSECLNRSRAV